jgi:hypothetical protein
MKILNYRSRLIPGCCSVVFPSFRYHQVGLFCEVATALWCSVFSMFGIQWVLPAKVLDMLAGWHNWFGRRSSAVWNLAPLCVMWSLWKERNRRIFEDLEKPFSHLQEQFSGLLFDCSRSWGFTEASSLPDFVVSLTAD